MLLSVFYSDGVCLSPGREPTLCGVIDAPAAGSEERENEQQRRRKKKRKDPEIKQSSRVKCGAGRWRD